MRIELFLFAEIWPTLGYSVLGLLGLAVLLLAWRPRWLFRPIVCLLTWPFYRIRVMGTENVPATGPALLVCNHISYIDWLLLLAAQRRFIRFVVFAAYTQTWGIRHILRWAGVIPIDGSAGPRSIVTSLKQASAALAKGELVCIFAEGRFTRTGFLLPFHRGFEQILKHHPAPIIPVCLDQVWGSIFSYFKSKLLWKLPQELPYSVSVAFGPALPATSTAAEVRLVIQKLSADCAFARSRQARSVHRQFVRMAAKHPFKPCMVDSVTKKWLNYGKTLTAAMCLAQQLRPLLAGEKYVGIWLPSSVGGALANITLALLGKTSVNLNYTASTETVQAGCKMTGLKFVLTSEAFLFARPLQIEGVQLVKLEEVRKQLTPRQQLFNFLKVLLLPGWVLERWVLRLPQHDQEETATIIFSSGSTAEPKGVMLSFRNITSNARSMVQAISLIPQDRLLGVLPLFHSFGYTVTLWAPLQVGASVVYHPDPRQAKKIGEMCTKESCTIFLTTSTFLGFYIRQCQPDDFKPLRILMCGAEKLVASVAQEFAKKFNLLPLEGYGCTELSPAVSANIPDVVLDGFRQIGTKHGSIGQPLPGIAVRTVDPDTNQVLKPGAEGMLQVYGPNVMQGYLGRDDLTKKAMTDDGWYITGDMAKIDEDGFITITGRLSRFAKCGGEMIALEKIEEHLQAVLQPSERIYVVTCVPDPSRGEKLVVLYTTLLEQEPRQLCAKLKERGLSNLEIPDFRDFYAVPELPVLGSGKLNLQKVKQMALEIAGK